LRPLGVGRLWEAWEDLEGGLQVQVEDLFEREVGQCCRRRAGSSCRASGDGHAAQRSDGDGLWQSTLLRRLCGVTGPLISTASSCRTTKSSFATAFSGP
jgi:hypothetical protein